MPTLIGKTVLPADLSISDLNDQELFDWMILASSNMLRKHFGLEALHCLKGPVSKLATRKNPSLDNYFAELMLRTIYEPSEEYPEFEEHVIRGSQESLPSDLNPGLVGAILIGIGGMSGNIDFSKVYDEHYFDGQRTHDSATEVVYQEHFKELVELPNVAAFDFFRKEINFIDSTGKAPYDHLINIAKNLHYTREKQDGESILLSPQKKRAILQAVLMSVIVSMGQFREYKTQTALTELEAYWNDFISKYDDEERFDRVSQSDLSFIRKKVIGSGESKVQKEISLFSHKRILFALQQVWEPEIVRMIIHWFFEGAVQAQTSFSRIRNRSLPFRHVYGKKYVFLYYQKTPFDAFPQRPILAQANEKKLRLLLVIEDPIRGIRAIFRNNFLFSDAWQVFYELLMEREPGNVWYTPTNEKGEIASFILNGTESFIDGPASTLRERDFEEIFIEAIQENWRRREAR